MTHTIEKYDYRENVVEDVLNYINENEIEITPENVSEVAEELNDTLWVADSVTGNASGSYTFNRWQAEEYLCHNLDLLAEACRAFDYSTYEQIANGAESCDILIRCYLLSSAIDTALSRILDTKNQ